MSKQKRAAATPPTAARATTGARSPAGAGTVRYRCPDTGATWSGRGLKPAWLRAALERGKTLASLAVEPAAKAAGKGPSGPKKQTDKAGKAGPSGAPDRDPNTADMFSGAPA